MREETKEKAAVPGTGGAELLQNPLGTEPVRGLLLQFAVPSIVAMLVGSLYNIVYQFFIGRSTDIDDVILNTAGALAGFWTFCLLRIIFPGFFETFHCRAKGGYNYG